MSNNGTDNASTSSSSFAQISLEKLLNAVDLLRYHNALKDELKLRHAGDIGDTDQVDLDGIGMTRPEQKRLMREYDKYYAADQPQQQNGVVWKKFSSRLKRFGEAKQRKSNRGESDGERQRPKGYQWREEGGSRTENRQPQHIIPIERITLCKKIGTGEFGHVFQAAWRDPTGDGKTATQVAVKRILPEKLISQHSSFLQEAAIMTRMHHPNVIRLFGVVLETRAVMLVSELAPCGSLLECLQCPSWREPFSVTVLSDFALQIAQGMRYLSNNRLIHRDLAARNVLVCTPTKVKISDFGLSRCLGHGEDYYRSEFSPSMKLPIAWCAPECINFLRFTSASDVWAYGVCLWEMFSYGKTPWEGLSGAQILHSIDTQRKKLHCPESCPRELYLLMLNCWEWEALSRLNFDQICDRLPSMVPPLLVTISESGTAKGGHLHYGRNEIIALLDKNPAEKPGLWRGVSKVGKVGLFHAEDTIAYLGAENPSTSSCTNRGSISDKVLAEKTKIKKRRDKESKRKKDVEISEPRGDLRHTCHVGADGRVFGLMNLARALPPDPSVPKDANGQMSNKLSPSDDAFLLTPLMSSSMVSLPPPRPPKKGSKQLGEDEMSKSVCVGQIIGGHSSTEYLNSSSTAASFSPPALPPKPPRFRFSDRPNPSAPMPSPSDILAYAQMGNAQSFTHSADQMHHHPLEPTTHCQQLKPFPLEPIEEGKSSTEQGQKFDEMEGHKRRGGGQTESGEQRTNGKPKEKERESDRNNGQEEEGQEEEEEENDDSLIRRPASVCCEFSKEPKSTEGEREEQRFMRVLTDLQRDLTNSLHSLEDCSDERPLLDGERRRERSMTEKEEQKKHHEQLALERHGIVTAYSAELVGMGQTELERRTNEERKKVLKKLIRHGEGCVDEKRASIVGNFIASASKMFVGNSYEGGEQYQQNNERPNNGTNGMAFPPSTKEPLTNWPPEAQEAYKLLVQCGHSLRGTWMDCGHLEERNKSPKSDDGIVGHTAEQIQLPKKIEYINSSLIRWEDKNSEKRTNQQAEAGRRSDRKEEEGEWNDRKTKMEKSDQKEKGVEWNGRKREMERNLLNGGFLLQSALSSPTVPPQNVPRSPPPVPPKPKARFGMGLGQQQHLMMTESTDCCDVNSSKIMP